MATMPHYHFTNLGRLLGDEVVKHTDVIVLGSGAAGLSCALRLAQQGHAVTVVSKGSLSSGSTLWAQGGISAVFDKDDSLDAHVRDTLTAGAGLCDEKAV